MEKLLGQGTFGQVVKCVREDTREVVAIKVIKNQQAFYQQACLAWRSACPVAGRALIQGERSKSSATATQIAVGPHSALWTEHQSCQTCRREFHSTQMARNDPEDKPSTLTSHNRGKTSAAMSSLQFQRTPKVHKCNPMCPACMYPSRASRRVSAGEGGGGDPAVPEQPGGP